MRSKLLTAAVLAIVLSAGPAARAADPPIFDFLGYAIVPTAQGGTLVMRSVLTNGVSVPAPISLDFANNQYTLVVTGTLAQVGPPQKYAPASVSFYEDPIGSGTAADYALPGTFTDGVLILSGSFDPELTRTRFTTNLGSFIGSIDFSGGTRLGDMPTALDWPFGGSWNRSVSGIPAGYDEMWDGKIDLATLAVQERDWGGVKDLYRR